MTLTITDTDARGHYSLTVCRAGHAIETGIELTVQRKHTTESVVIAHADWQQLCKMGAEL